MRGRVGQDYSVDEAQDAARCVMVNMLASLKGEGAPLCMLPFSFGLIAVCIPAEIGDLDKIVRVVKLTGYINCVDGFSGQPQVGALRCCPQPVSSVICVLALGAEWSLGFLGGSVW